MPHFEGILGQVHYRHFAAPAPVGQVVLLHGYGEHGGLYHRIAYHLNAWGLDVLVPDAIGHGLSAGARGDPVSIDALRVDAASMAEIARAARPDLPMVLAGHSMGAVTAAALAASHPEAFQGVALSAPPLDGVRPDQEQAIADSVWSLDPFYIDELETDPLRPDPAIAFGTLVRILSPAVCAPILASLERVDLPILILSGEIDAFCPPDRPSAWASRLARGHSHVFAGGHHDVINEVMHVQVAALIASSLLDAIRAARGAAGLPGDADR